MFDFDHSRADEDRRRTRCRSAAILLVLVFAASTLAVSIVVPSPIRGASSDPVATGLSDDFTHDTALNTNLWQVNGTVGLAFAAVNCGQGYCTNVTLVPSFSSQGMEIAQVNEGAEMGTIQSVASFSPPFTVTAVVEGVVSNGHPFVFAVTSSTATAGVQITGNLNPDDCSHEADCGNPTVCGIPANPSIGSNQCFYGIYARIGTSNGNWKKTGDLNSTPNVGIGYTLQISVDGSGNAQYNVSQGGQILGQSTAQVGTGPFYLILAQSEGAPVPGPGPNEAYWTSVSLTPSVVSSSPPSSSSSTSGISSIDWAILVVVAVVVLLAIVLLAYRRRRKLTVTVVEAGTFAPVPGAGVSATGPENRSGNTGNDGRVAFGGVKEGDYLVRAGASGYAMSIPVTVSVQRTAEHTVMLDRATPSAQPLGGSQVPPGEPIRPTIEPPREATPPVPPPPAPAIPPAAAAPAPTSLPEDEGMEGWAGERIREIIRTFQMKGALSPETALTAEELGLSRMFVRIMRRRRGRTRVFIEINGKYYLDQNALQKMR